MISLKEIEKVEVICLVDNCVDLLLPSTQIVHRPSVTKNWYEQPPIAEHGFSVAITFETNGKQHRILFDSGISPFAATYNSEVLNFDLSYCKAVISSHGHPDHTGGLFNIRKKMNSRDIPIIIHEDAFRKRSFRFPDGKILDLPAPNKSSLVESGYDIMERNFPSLWIEDSFLVIGEIPRTNNFEKGLPNHYSEVNGKMEPEPVIKDDQTIVFNIKDKGLVIITGCGHSGIINTINYAKELTGQDKIYAVMGGRHLSGGIYESIIPRTVNELERLKPRFIIPCHCSGLKFVSEISKHMPTAFVQNSVGTSYVF